MNATETQRGFGVCDSATARAVRYRHVGALPTAIAFGMGDVGEAVLEYGRRVLTTWGRNLNPDRQFWYSHKTAFQPVWMGNSDGLAELILCDSDVTSPVAEWIWAGLRLACEDGPVWTEVSDE